MEYPVFDIAEFGKALKSSRKLARLSAQELSDICGIPRSTIQKLEVADNKSVTVQQALTLAEALGLSLEELLFPTRESLAGGLAASEFVAVARKVVAMADGDSNG